MQSDRAIRIILRELHVQARDSITSLLKQAHVVSKSVQARAQGSCSRSCMTARGPCNPRISQGIEQSMWDLFGVSTRAQGGTVVARTS